MTIAVVGKYVGLEDAYKCLHEALVHGGIKHGVKVNVKWVEAEELEQEGGDGLLDGATASWCRAASATAARRGMMRGGRNRADAADPVLRHLLRHPVGDRRVRARTSAA